MRFYMAYIDDSPDPAQSDPTASATPDRTVFIGAFVTPYIKERLRRDAYAAEGGPRSLSWALNRILEDYYKGQPE